MYRGHVGFDALGFARVRDLPPIQRRKTNRRGLDYTGRLRRQNLGAYIAGGDEMMDREGGYVYLL